MSNVNLLSSPSALTFVNTPITGHSALLGNLPDLTAGDSWIYQTIAVPAGTTTLTLQYWPRSDDSLSFEQMECQIQNNSGGFLAQVFLVDDNTQAWTGVTYDLSAYAGQTIRIFFRVTVDGANDGSIMYLDAISVKNGSTELMQHGAFDTGDFTGWTTGGGYAPSISQQEVFGQGPPDPQTVAISASDSS